MGRVLNATFASPKYVDILPDALNVGTPIDDEFVVSRSKTGVLSRYGDTTWDFSPYSANRVVFDFEELAGRDGELASVLVREVKLIMFMMLFSGIKTAGRKNQKANSLKAYHSVVLDISKCAHSVGVPLSEAAQSDAFLMAFKSSIVSLEADTTLGHIKALLLFLSRASHTSSLAPYDIPIVIPKNQLSDVLIMIDKVRSAIDREVERTPLIPTRILSELISGCEDHVSKCAPYLDGTISLVNKVYNDPGTSPSYGINDSSAKSAHSAFKGRKSLKAKRGVGAEWSWKTEKHTLVTLEDAAKEHDCLELFTLGQSANIGFKSLKEFLSSVRVAGEILVHAYTGMRLHEVRVLPYDFFGRLEIYGMNSIPVVKSFTSKIDAKNYSEGTVWVSSNRLEIVAKVLQKIARIFYIFNSAAPVDVSKLPIFISPLWGGTAEPVHYDYPLAKTGVYQPETKHPDPLWFLDRIAIESSDIEELVTFDAFRDWDKDSRFEVGKKWPLASHQFRRSVAVYASRSGMVSLPSLATQFKHLSAAMTAIYAENSSFAKQILYKEGEIPATHGVIKDFQQAKVFNAATRFHEVVIANQNRLRGGYGKKIQRFKDNGTLPLIMSDRVKTEKAMSTGRMSFVETMAGGCMRNGGTCKEYGLYEVTPCFGGCPDAIVDDGKAAVYVEGLEFELSYMEPGSLQYAAIQKEIYDIKAKLSERVES